MNTHDKYELPPLPASEEVTRQLENAFPWVEVHILMVDYARAAIKADRQRRGEPVVLATYHAIVDDSEEHIMQDTLTNQLEIYDEREDAVKAAPDHLSVVPIYVTATEGPLYTTPQPAEPVSKTDWSNELSSWSDEDFIRIFHERPDLANRLRKMLAEPVKVPREDERAAKGLPPYSPCKPTEEEWSRLTGNGRKAWGEPVKVPRDDIDIKDVREYLDAWGCLAHPGVVSLLNWYGHQLTAPKGWQLVPKEPTEEMLVDAMEASLLGRPSPDDDSYVRRIVKAWCAAAPKFGEEE